MPVTRPALCCAAASRCSNFQGESDCSQAQGCTDSTNHHTETSGAVKPQEGIGSHELKETPAYVVEGLRRGNLFKNRFRVYWILWSLHSIIPCSLSFN